MPSVPLVVTDIYQMALDLIALKAKVPELEARIYALERRVEAPAAAPELATDRA